MRKLAHLDSSIILVGNLNRHTLDKFNVNEGAFIWSCLWAHLRYAMICKKQVQYEPTR
jgi:hypothetical protein